MAMEYAQHARDISEILTQAILDQIESQAGEVNMPAIFAKLFLISDILHNSSNPQITTAWTYRREFESRLCSVFESLNKLWMIKVSGKLT